MASCVLCLEAIKVFEHPACSSTLSPGCKLDDLDKMCPGPDTRASQPCQCMQKVMMLQALNYVHGMHELLSQALRAALDDLPLVAKPKPQRHAPQGGGKNRAAGPDTTAAQFLSMAPTELQDILRKMSNPDTESIVTLVRSTNSLKRFAAAATKEQRNKLLTHRPQTCVDPGTVSPDLKPGAELPGLLPGASASDRVLAVLLFVWGHHVRGLTRKQLKPKAATLGVPHHRLRMAQHWHTLLCTHPGILRLALQGHATDTLWKNAHDLCLLLQDLSQSDQYKDKVALLAFRQHVCFECVVLGHCTCEK